MSPVHAGVLAALKLFGSLPGRALETTRDGSLLYASGAPDASENYLGIGQSGGGRETVEAALAFFTHHALPFACPLFGNASPEMRRALETLEASRKASRTWMTCMRFTQHTKNAQNTKKTQKIAPFVPEEPRPFTFSRLQGKAQARAWADAAWVGDDEDSSASSANAAPEQTEQTEQTEQKTPEAFRSFAAACATHPDITLYAAEKVGRETRKICATLLAAHTALGTAIFYVATRPEWRRRGLATSLLGKALADAALPNAFLLATDAGEAIYRKFGFTDEGTEGRIPVYLVRP